MLNNILRRTSSLVPLSLKVRDYCVSSILNMKIGTHDGVFHCDEVLACYMLKTLPEYKDAEIVRTRDMSILNDCDIVVDVGGTFDHEKKRYDHHQASFEETFSRLRPEFGDRYKIKLSSAGLIYTFYGEQIIKQLAKDLSKEDLSIIFKKVYELFIEEIDAIDNGVPITDGQTNYEIHSHLSSRVGRLNPEWNSSEELDVNELFKKAMDLVSEEFQHVTRYYINVWLPARDLVQKAIDGRFEVHNSGQILLLNERFPWKQHLFDMEEKLSLGTEIKFVLFHDKPKSWRVQGVPISPSSFVLRKPLHKVWRGVRDDALSKVSGIDGCIFCHSSGFIGGNVTKEGALEMAVESLKADD